MSLTRKLLGSTFFIIAVLIATVSLLSYRFIRTALQERLSREQMGLAKKAMQSIDDLLYERYVTIRSIAGESAFQTVLKVPGNRPSRTVLSRIKELAVVTGPWNKLFVVDTEGRILLSSDESMIGRSIAAEPHRLVGFREAAKGLTYHSDRIRFEDTRKDAMFFSAPVRDADDPKHRIVGAVMGGFAWPAVVELLDRMPVRALLVKRDGSVIADNAEGEDNLTDLNMKDCPFLKKGVLEGVAATVNCPGGSDFMDMPSLVSYTPQKGKFSFEPSGWSLIVASPLKEVFAPASRTAWRLVLLLLPFLLLTYVVMALLITRLVLRPIKALSGTARAIQEGDHARRVPIATHDEFGDLAWAFNGMLASLNESTVSRNWFEVLVSSIGDAVIAADEKMEITFMNKVAIELSGWSVEEVVKARKSFTDVFRIIHAQTRETVPNPIERVLKEDVVVGLGNHTLLIDREGREIPIDDSAAPIHNPDGKVVGAVLVFRDVTERYRKDRALAASENRYRAVTESVADAIVSIDARGAVVFWSPQAARIFGYESGDILGKGLTLIMPERFRERHRRGLAHYLETREPKVLGRTVELVGLRKSGEEFPMELTLSAWEKDEDLLFTGVIRDITERRRSDEEKNFMQLQLNQAQKMRSIGQLAAGVAHEINNPIQYVEGNAEFLRDAIAKFESVFAAIETGIAARGVAGDAEQALSELRRRFANGELAALRGEVPKAIDQSLEGIRQIAKIVAALKEFSHPGSQKKTALDINHLIETTLTIARNEWKYVAEVVSDFDRELPPVPCLPHEIHQVFLNLIVNASQAIAEKKQREGGSGPMGTIVIKTCSEGGYVEVRVKDSGTGIPEAHRSRIFDPFFTTKAVGKGTGQGLALVHAYVVEGHGGTVHFETEPGVGTTFIVKLPLG